MNVRYYKRRTPELRNKFNDIAEDYDACRFSYPAELYSSIWEYAGNFSRALEIGAGTGKATGAFLSRGCEIVAIEPCSRMLECGRRKFSTERLTWRNVTFEEYVCTVPFDMVYAASSFQWLSGDDRVRRVFAMLCPGGVFARFKTRNVVAPERSMSNGRLMELYARYFPELAPRSGERRHMGASEYVSAGFVAPLEKEFHVPHVIPVADYVRLMRTYTEYLMFPAAKRALFEDAILSELTSGRIELDQKCSLSLWRRP